MPRGRITSRELLGGKGAGLAEMTRLGLPVPPGFTLPTTICTEFSAGNRLPAGLREQMFRTVEKIGEVLDRGFGDPDRPLLVSVRSGARVSMPGMMDTVLNLGLNHSTVEGLAEDSGDDRFAWDAYRRFVAMYGDVVLGLCDEEHGNPFEAFLIREKKRHRVGEDHELPAEALRRVAESGLAYVQDRTGRPFPSSPQEQLVGAVKSVFQSWNNDRARAYRRMHGIPDDWGTAVNVQAMVFGNLGADSGTGVAFTRDPATGEKVLYGEYLLNAQGEDVVAGTRTPLPIALLEKAMPKVHRELLRLRKVLEDHFGDMQDVEFTIERGELFLLQTRTGKRTGAAAVRIATDLVKERRLKPEEALLRIEAESLTQLLAPVFSVREKDKALAAGRSLARGLNAGPGAATGRLVFTARDAVEWAARGEDVVLARQETSPEDIRGMQAARGVLTQHGGMTSHAALVARQMGRVCVAGCGDAAIDAGRKRLAAGGRILHEGDWVSLDGTTGQVVEGRIPTHESPVLKVVVGAAKPTRDGDDARFRQVLAWADRVRRLKVRANADQPDQAELAIALGAEGIGLCRTEHMFFGEEKLPAMQRMILADGPEARQAALSAILPLQQKDFEGLFRAMAGRPVTIRTLDPPLHEFLPHDDKEIRELAARLELPARQVRERVKALHESNPMLGFRGCRLTWLIPEILDVQARAIFRAAATLRGEGKTVRPEIMIPLVGHRAELAAHRTRIEAIAAEEAARSGTRVSFKVGTMIEVPRAALTAGEIAVEADFFSFGTNDLTQTVLAMSRDDGGTFLPAYVDAGVYGKDPFVSIDVDGVGRLLALAVKEGRRARPGLKVGICGEHGGDPASVELCEKLQLDYVSCSPFRLPVARLAAAQAVLRA
ncbi:MAG TPA: pyruvate, phosphate dikinase [Planctomycetota bacterium]